ncbi:MAG: hypothetical protein PHS54_01650 [Clostridia bacterium]|nr:hypothetical protein [Clostridia bacterium]
MEVQESGEVALSEDEKAEWKLNFVDNLKKYCNEISKVTGMAGALLGLIFSRPLAFLSKRQESREEDSEQTEL